TITTPAMTMAGVILGTAAYMAPEQARGKFVDKRADIWAFGCVLFEALTGRRAFTGESVPDTMASIVRDEPDWSLLPPATPVKVRELLRRSMQKNPTNRLRDIGDARFELDLASSSPEVRTPGKRQRAWMLASAVLAAALAVVSVVALRSFPAPKG